MALIAAKKSAVCTIAYWKRWQSIEFQAGEASIVNVHVLAGRNRKPRSLAATRKLLSQSSTWRR